MERSIADRLNTGWVLDYPAGVFKNPGLTAELIDLASMAVSKTPELYMPFDSDNLVNGYVEIQILPPMTKIVPGGVYRTKTHRVHVREFGISCEMVSAEQMAKGVPVQATYERLLHWIGVWCNNVYAWTLMPELRRKAEYDPASKRHYPGQMVGWYGKGFLNSEWFGKPGSSEMVPSVLGEGEVAYSTSKPDVVDAVRYTTATPTPPQLKKRKYDWTYDAPLRIPVRGVRPAPNVVPLTTLVEQAKKVHYHAAPPCDYPGCAAMTITVPLLDTAETADNPLCKVPAKHAPWCECATL